MRKVEIEKTIIVETINSCRYKKDAAKKLGIDIATLRKLMAEYNLEYPKHKSQINPNKQFSKYSNIDRKWFVDYWQNSTKSLTALSIEHNVPLSVIEGRRAYYGLKKRFKYQVSERIYDYTDPNVAYFAGLLATDGYIPKNRLAVELDLTGVDEKDLLEKIREYFECNAPIQSYGNSNRLRISAENLVSFFEQNFNLYGENKTFNVSTPRSFASEDCAKAYVRGCLDGDGSVYKNRYQFVICNASYNLISGLADIIENYTKQHLNVRIISGQNNDYYQIGTTDRKARLVLEWIYSGTGFKLNRKYNKFLENYKNQS